MPTHRYRFTGLIAEDFPAPPIARQLQPGDEIELPEPVEHARLEPIPPPKTRKTAVVEPASTDKE